MLGLRCRFACGWSWSDGIAVGFPRIAEGGDVLGQAFGWHAAQPADLDRFELAGHDQPVHERAAEPEPFGGLVDGQQQARWLGLAGSQSRRSWRCLRLLLVLPPGVGDDGGVLVVGPQLRAPGGELLPLGPRLAGDELRVMGGHADRGWSQDRQVQTKDRCRHGASVSGRPAA